jgi:hypothetical protein
MSPIPGRFSLRKLSGERRCSEASMNYTPSGRAHEYPGSRPSAFPIRAAAALYPLAEATGGGGRGGGRGGGGGALRPSSSDRARRSRARDAVITSATTRLARSRRRGRSPGRKRRLGRPVGAGRDLHRVRPPGCASEGGSLPPLGSSPRARGAARLDDQEVRPAAQVGESRSAAPALTIPGRCPPRREERRRDARAGRVGGRRRRPSRPFRLPQLSELPDGPAGGTSLDPRRAGPALSTARERRDGRRMCTFCSAENFCPGLRPWGAGTRAQAVSRKR